MEASAKLCQAVAKQDKGWPVGCIGLSCLGNYCLDYKDCIRQPLDYKREIHRHNRLNCLLKAQGACQDCQQSSTDWHALLLLYGGTYRALWLLRAVIGPGASYFSWCLRLLCPQPLFFLPPKASAVWHLGW